MDDLPKKMGKRKSGLVVMGDQPRWKNGRIVITNLPTQNMARAQKHTRKEVGLQNALPKRWELKSALKKKVRAQRCTGNEVEL